MRQYALITGSYWAFTLTDGALRMLVVLYFHQLGYSPLDIALLFLFYELFGVVTNLLGGWIAARVGLAATLIAGLLLQVAALHAAGGRKILDRCLCHGGTGHIGRRQRSQ